MSDDALCITALDRTFEHGLGLFETMRTWNGHATLLERHLERLRNSASVLGLTLDPSQLPDRRAVADLLLADGREGDAIVRITLSGGIDESSGSTVWMRSSALPIELPVKGVSLDGRFRVDAGDPLVRHKTLNYWRRRLAYEQAVAAGYFDALAETADGLVWESSRANLFVVARGTLLTPPLAGPVLPGIMRSQVIMSASDDRVPAVETTVDLNAEPIEEAFLTNSVRGIIPVASIDGRRLMSAGARSSWLWLGLRRKLEAGVADP